MFKVKYVTEDIIPGRYRAELDSDDIYQYEAYFTCMENKELDKLWQSHVELFKKGTGVVLFEKWFDGVVKKDKKIISRLVNEFIEEVNQQ